LKVFKNISLKKYNTFGLDYLASKFIIIDTEEEAESVLKDAAPAKEPVLILGSGSNILFTSDFNGTIINPQIGGINVEGQKDDHLLVSVGAGVKWDDFVEWCVGNNLGGIENLSLIPGTTGASPVQNIGAYGSELKDVIVKVRALRIGSGSLVELNNKQCGFGYRDSIFKRELRNKYLITRVYYKLTSKPVLNYNYGSLKGEVEILGPPTLKTVRQAVINLRRKKLPDPEITGNAGSFFKNPLIEDHEAIRLRKLFPGMPVYPDCHGRSKLAAGWLIEQCGWKGKRYGNAGIHDKQALVLINFGNSTGQEIFDLSEKVRESVLEKFGILLEREVNIF
jgi:UDP-N-acetylmuramate dehydrogenase